MILPTSPSIVAADPMLLLVRDLKEMKAKFRALITIIPPPPSGDGEMIQEELTAVGIPIFQTMIRRRSIFEKAAIKGKPVSMLTEARAVLAWEEYQSLGKEVEVML